MAIEPLGQMRAIIGATVIDGTGRSPIKDGVILVRGARIVEVGDSRTPIPADAERIFASGKFVIPGLIEPYTVLTPNGWPPVLIEYEGRHHELIIESAQLALKAGITTVLDGAGARDTLITAREAISNGRAVGARIYLCGNQIGSAGPFSPDLRDHSQENVGEDSAKRRIGRVIAEVDPAFKARLNASWELNVGEPMARLSLDAARKEVHEYVRSGIDYAAFSINAHRFGSYHYIMYSPRVQRMIVEESRDAGIPVMALFATTEEGANMALDLEPDCWMHASWGRKSLTHTTLERVVRSRIPLHLAAASMDDMEWYRRQPDSALWPGFLEMLETKHADNRALIATGVPIVSSPNTAVMTPGERKVFGGTIPPNGFPDLGVSHVKNLQALQDLGLPASDALVATTLNAARAFKLDRDLGSLERGKLADIVILNADPLARSENYLTVSTVLKEGAVVNRDVLPSQALWSVDAE